MKIYLTAGDIVSDMHQRGFVDDFELVVNKLLWVQKRIYLERNYFFIIECHRFLDARGHELVISGIATDCLTGKGILVNHYPDPTFVRPALIERKIESLFSIASDNDGKYGGVFATDFF